MQKKLNSIDSVSGRLWRSARMNIMTKLFVGLALMFMLSVFELAAENCKWLFNYNQAVERAKQEKKTVFMLFTGSDWCPACMHLHEKVLSSAEFKQYAEKKLVLVMVDFPQQKRLFPFHEKYNRELAEKFNIEGYPTIILIDGQGKELKRMYYGGEDTAKFIKILEDDSTAEKDSESDASCLSPEKIHELVKFPPPDKIYCYLDYLERLSCWLTGFMTKKQLAQGKMTEAAAEWISEVIRNFYDFPDSQSYAQLKTTGKKLYEGKDRNSPYFLVWYIRFINREAENKDYRTILRKLRTALITDKEISALLQIFYAINTNRKTLQYLEKWCESENFDGADAQIIYRFIRGTIPNKAENYRRIISKIEHAKVDPWLLTMINADLEQKLAWDSRGSSWANTVTESGWEGYKNHGDKAYKLYCKAYEMHPEWVESAAELVYVTGTGRGSEYEMLQWFNRALAAQIDYKPAYRSFMWCIRPRWGGSWDEMLALGTKCAEIDKSLYYLNVPLVFVWSVFDVAGEMDYCQRRKFMQEMRPKVEEVLNAKIACCVKAPGKGYIDHFKAVIAKYAFMCGDYETAGKIFAKIPGNYNGYSALAACNNGYLSMSRADMDTEIGLATGSFAQEFKEIGRFIEAGKTEEAAKKYLVLLKQSKNEVEKHILENKSACLFLNNKRQLPSLDKGIFALARCGCVEGVNAFLDAGYDVNCRGKDNCTLLQRSLQQDCDYEMTQEYADVKIAMLKFLLSRGADINALAGPKWTALHLSVSNKLPVSVMAFILKQKGVDINCGDCDRETPLMWSVMLDLKDHASYLIAKGADPNRKDRHGKRAIDYAKSDEMRQLLLAAANK